jgi:hypothetical protein
MKERIVEETMKFETLANQINDGKRQIAQMEDTALIIKGRINMLQELDKEATDVVKEEEPQKEE